jgi:hypothetical protein
LLKPFITLGANIPLAVIIVVIKRSNVDSKEFQMQEYGRMMVLPPLISKKY